MRMFNELLAAQAVSLEAASAVPGPEYTGRYLVLLREDASPAKGAEFLSDRNLNVVSTADFEQGILPEEEARRVDGVVFHNIGVALVDAPPEQMAGVAAATATESPIQAVEPERVCY